MNDKNGWIDQTTGDWCSDGWGCGDVADGLITGVGEG